MSLEVKVPSVGESINEVTIAQWTKKEGEYVEMDDVICELESDKATFELTAEKSGTLKILVKEGETVSIGTAIGNIEEGEGPSKNLPEGQQSKSTNSSEPKKTGKVIEMKVPVVAESITEVTLSNWLKADGDLVALDEGIAEIESDKATFELPAETQGKLQIIAKEGDTLKIGDLICRIEEMEGGAEEAPSAALQQEMTAPIPQNEDNYATGHPSPAAAKIMSERGISSDQIKGTGKDGRITKEDALKTEKNTTEKTVDPKQEQPASPAIGGSRDQNRQKMSSLRKTIARRLVAVKNETAMLTTFNEVDMQPVMDIRKKYKDSFKEKYEVNLGFMSFFTKACCLALTEWPAVNAMIDGDELVYNNFCDISIAVSTPKGLVVPVIRNAEHMSFEQIEKEIIRLATKARDGKLSIEEMQGGTFTITNGGVFGSMLSTPIINSPQSAILGMHNIVQRPVAIDGEVKIRPIMYVALSYDHRIVDGRESVSFLVRLKELLEDPTPLLFSI